MKVWNMLGLSALALTLLASSTRADDTQKDLPGPIDSLEDLQDSGKMLFKLADENNDGQVSQQEAIDAGNLLVGGFFFRADADGNGSVSREEMRAARDKILAQKPILRVLLSRTRANAPGAPGAAGNAPGAAGNAPGAAGGTPNPAQGLLTLLDSNNDRQIQATELRQMVQTTVQSSFAAADTNRDGQMSPSELNAAVAGAARAAGQAAYQQADTNSDGQLSRDEFDKAIIEPANMVFQILDSNGDSRISPQEFQTAQRFIASQVRGLNTPEPANSPRNLIRTGRTPGEVSPVPNFNTNPANRPGQPAVPGQPAPAQPAPTQPR